MYSPPQTFEDGIAYDEQLYQEMIIFSFASVLSDMFQQRIILHGMAEERIMRELLATEKSRTRVNAIKKQQWVPSGIRDFMSEAFSCNFRGINVLTVWKIIVNNYCQFAFNAYCTMMNLLGVQPDSRVFGAVFVHHFLPYAGVIFAKDDWLSLKRGELITATPWRGDEIGRLLAKPGCFDQLFSTKVYRSVMNNPERAYLILNDPALRHQIFVSTRPGLPGQPGTPGGGMAAFQQANNGPEFFRQRMLDPHLAVAGHCEDKYKHIIREAPWIIEEMLYNPELIFLLDNNRLQLEEVLHKPSLFGIRPLGVESIAVLMFASQGMLKRVSGEADLVTNAVRKSLPAAFTQKGLDRMVTVLGLDPGFNWTPRKVFKMISCPFKKV
jgi:hypothetical protein